MDAWIETLQQALPAIITGIIAAVSAYLVATTNKRGTREVALINELQEQMKVMQGRMDLQDERIDELRRRSYQKDEYISILRQHIFEMKPPPPPEPPKDCPLESGGR